MNSFAETSFGYHVKYSPLSFELADTAYFHICDITLERFGYPDPPEGEMLSHGRHCNLSGSGLWRDRK